MRVLNARVVGMTREGAVYVGRPSRWGNPYSHRPGIYVERIVNSRSEAIRLYRVMLARKTPGELEEYLAPLRGKNLICWCAPEPCHADVLLALANGGLHP